MSTPKLMAALVARTLGNRVPLEAHFDLTYRCNERCIHCYVDHTDRGELATNEIFSVLNQLRDAGTLFLTFSGGEAFLRRDVFTILEHARQQHFDLSVKTNATLLDVGKVERLKQVGVRRVQVSIYSADPTVHDGITKKVGSLQRSLDAIWLLRCAGISVKIACPLMTSNRDCYREVIALAEQMGVTYTIEPTISPGMNGNLGLLRLRTRADELLPILAAGAIGTPATQSGSSRPADKDPIATIPCGAGHNSVYISPYGDVYPCVQMPVPAGNLRRQSFWEIWYGSDDMGRVRRLQQDEICRTCSIRQYCQRCPGLALMEEGNASAPYSRACATAEAKAALAGERDPRSGFHLRQMNNACLIPLVTGNSTRS